MSQQQEFLFVNPDNKTRGGHKISTKARAFVIRNARAAQPWSTKSTTRGTKRRQGSQVANDGNEQQLPVNQQHSSSLPATDLVRKTPRISSKPTRVACGRTTRSGPNTEVPGAQCLRVQTGPAAPQHRAQWHSRLPRKGYTWADSFPTADLWTQSHLFGRFDPFYTLSVVINDQDATLLEYCKY